MQATESKSKSKGKRNDKAPAEATIGAVVAAAAVAAAPVAEPEPCPIPTADQLGQLDTSSLGQLAGAEYAAGEYLRTVHWLRAGAYAAEYVTRWVGKGYERKEATRDMESAIRMAAGCPADVHTLIQAYHVWRLVGCQGEGWVHPGKLPWSGFKALLALVQRPDPAKEEWVINAKADADAAKALFADWALPKDGQRMPVDTLQQRVDLLLGKAPVATDAAAPDGETPTPDGKPEEGKPAETPPAVTPPAADPAKPDGETEEDDGEDEPEGIASVLPAGPSGETNAADPRAHMARSFKAGTVADAAALVCDLLCERDDADDVLVSLIRDYYGLTPTVAVQLVKAILAGAGPETRNQVYQLVAGPTNGRKAG